MGVRIDESRYHHAAAEVGYLNTVGYIRVGAGVVADIDELAVLDDDRLGPGPLLIDGVDFAVGQYPIGPRCNRVLLLVAGGESKANECQAYCQCVAHDLIEDVGFKPETPIETGIENFIEWYKDFYGYE